MLDFLMVSTRVPRKGVVEIYPKFIIGNRKDLMIRGGDFYAFWNEEKGLWSTDEDDVKDIIDKELDNYAKEHKERYGDDHVTVMHMWDSDTGMIDKWHKYCQKQQRDHYYPLDEKLMFSNYECKKEDYSSKRLNYPLKEGSHDSYDELMSVLYSEDERHKIEWAIGSIVTGASKTLQKFVVLYGPPRSGKSTVLNIIEWLFDGYYAPFDAESLGSANDSFSLEQFRSNPLVAISQDGDLSRIEKNTRLNSLTSHEQMVVNEKHKNLYSMRFNSFLFMGTNKYVRITDAKSGIIRRLIDVSPTGNKIPHDRYSDLMRNIQFELGAIACHCRDVFLEDPNAYDDYKPVLMMDESNDFYNFMSDSYQIFAKEDGTTLKAAWDMYKEYCDDARVPYTMSRRSFKSELRNYFDNYEERMRVGEDWVRSWYYGFKKDIFTSNKKENSKKSSKKSNTIDFKEQPSVFDIYCKDCFAQYANENETPSYKWEKIKTKLSNIDTRKLHYVKIPENHIVIDFDIKDENGNKSFEKNLLEASKWPKTYAELSKSGAGIHLHYIYDGDVTKLSRIYADNIEIKVFTGNSSLRRKLTKCNNEQIATISSGLPLNNKGDKNVVNIESLKNEKALRTLIKQCLNKEHHGATKPEIDFIFKALEDAYNNNLKYDVSDLHNSILAFAASSSHQADYCMNLVPKMHFKSDTASDTESCDDRITFFDVEVFPNLFLINWKYINEKSIKRMINPSPAEVEALCKHKLVGFNCRRYDNHMLYARILGYTNEEIFKLSQNIIVNGKGFFSEAYNISYTDIYDFSSVKQSLKAFEIELGLHHQEFGLPWDQPVPEELWAKVAEYCDNDVIATEAVWFDRQTDFLARQILADLADMTVNDTTNSLTTRLIFGKERNPKLNYTDLATGEQTDPVPNGHKDLYIQSFPGYEFIFDENGKPHNMYRGTDLGFGGYVDATPGMHFNVALLDIASLHPHSAIAMDAFGEYTKIFEELVEARVCIKHGEYDKAKSMFNGKLAKYLDDPKVAKKLSSALKIAINSVYGLTSASFSNPFKDIRNRNNIVALRGALFMKTLQDEVIKRGYTVAHIKTDSIKIPNATKDIIDFCMDFANKYGYTFEHEATYEKMCLVNNAVYIAKYSDDEVNGEHKGEWTATGAEFQVPYIFKKCFSKEEIEFKDLQEKKEVKSSIYLQDPDTENLKFVGKIGSFVPVKKECGGKLLVKPVKKSDGSTKYDSVTGAKGYYWLETEDVYEQENWKDIIDYDYFNNLVDDAINHINEFGDYEMFSGSLS